MNAAEALPEVQMAPLVFQFVGEEMFLKIISVYLLNNFHVPFSYNQGKLCCSMEPFKISINLIDILDSNLEITTNVFSLLWKTSKD